MRLKTSAIASICGSPQCASGCVAGCTSNVRSPRVIASSPAPRFVRQWASRLSRRSRNASRPASCCGSVVGATSTGAEAGAALRAEKDFTGGSL